MTAVTSPNGRTYSRLYAWIPTRMSSGLHVWLDYYYIRPDYLGQGVLLNQQEYLLDQA
jgi:hypothetical protein